MPISVTAMAPGPEEHDLAGENPGCNILAATLASAFIFACSNNGFVQFSPFCFMNVDNCQGTAGNMSFLAKELRAIVRGGRLLCI